MAALARILLVEDAPTEWGLALSSLPGKRMMDETAVVSDRDEALDFLHARGLFRHRGSGLPAVVVLGPSLKANAALSLLGYIRNDATLHQVPVVLIAAQLDAELVRRAYECGANSVIRAHAEAKVQAGQYAALAQFWVRANEPPPGCLPSPNAQHATE